MQIVPVVVGELGSVTKRADCVVVVGELGSVTKSADCASGCR